MTKSNYYDNVDWKAVCADWPDDFTEKFLEEFKVHPSFIHFAIEATGTSSVPLHSCQEERDGFGVSAFR